jgi:hypothetical protein
MELTYEKMMQHIDKYFDLVPTIDTAADRGIRKKVEDFFSEDFEIRWSTPVKFHNRQEWVDHLCGHSDDYKAIIHFKKRPYYVFIDDRKKMAACFIREQMKNTKTGQIMKDFLLNVHFEFKLVDGKVKFSHELISHIEPRYKVDSLTE